MAQALSQDARFDFIIVGGGTAGCILAETLTRSGRSNVLLVEAGGEARSPWIRVPAGFYKLLVNTRYNWGFWSTEEAATNFRRIAIPRGNSPPSAAAVMLFPQPLSPTSAVVRPAHSRKSTSPTTSRRRPSSTK